MAFQIINPLFALTVASFILIYIFYKKPKGNIAILFIILILSFLGINICEILILNFIFPEVFIKFMYSLVIISIALFMHFILNFTEIKYFKKIEFQALIYIFPLILIFLTLFTKVVISEVDYVYIKEDEKIVRATILIFMDIYGLGLLFIYSFLYSTNASGLLFLKFLREKIETKKKKMGAVLLGTVPFAIAYPFSFCFLKLFTEYFTEEQLILIDLITHVAVLITYILFSYVVISKVLIIVPKREIELLKEEIISRCGIDCRKCESFKNESCFGCIRTNEEEVVCDIYRCVVNKNIENCINCFDFEDCETFRITIHKRHGRRFEKVVEGTYIIKEEVASEGYELFRTYLMHGASGCCITRTYPAKIREKYKLRETPIIWLSTTPAPDEKIITINPTDIATLITKIKDFLITTKEEGIVLIDGVEYLTLHNSSELVAKMIQSLNEFVVMRKAKLIITLNPKGVDEKVMRILEREMKMIDKMPKKYKCSRCNIEYTSQTGICQGCKKRGVEIVSGK